MRKVGTLLGLTLVALAGPARAEEATPAATATPTAGDAAAPLTPPPAATPPIAPAPSATVAAAPAAPASEPAPRKLQVGLAFLPMAMGKYVYSSGPLTTVTAEAAFAYGMSLSLGYEVMPHLLVGFAPQVIANVREKAPEIPSEAVREYDLMARVAYVYPIESNTSVYAEVLPGYSLIKNDAAPAGLVVAVGAGAAIDFADRYFINLGVGYQMGFQKWKEGANSYDTKTRYVRVALGGGVKF